MQVLKKTFRYIKDYVLSNDILLLSLSLAASVLSCMLIASLYPESISSYKPVYTQALTGIAGFIMAVAISCFDYHNIVKLWKIIAPVGLILCLLVFTPLGSLRGGTGMGSDDRNWLNIGFTVIQPSEFLKVVFVITFSLHCYRVKNHINEIKTIVPVVLHAAIPIGIILLQGDYGTMIIFVAVFLCILYAAGINLKIILIGSSVAIAALIIFWNFILPVYLKSRFTAVYHLEDEKLGEGMQQYLGRITLGSGKMFGKGFNSDNLLTSTPELYNDMMFAHIGQVLGFIGCLGVVIWILVFCFRVLNNGFKAGDDLGKYICVGVFAVIFFQAVINIGMVLCLTPVIGVTLPFFSAGGSSVLTTYLLLGLVLSVYRFTPKYNLF